MPDLTPEQDAEVRNAINYPWHLDERGHRELTMKWTPEMCDFAETLIPHKCSNWELVQPAIKEMRVLRAERVQELADKTKLAAERAHLEVAKEQLEVLKTPRVHWTTTPGFWVAVLALAVAIAALVVAILK